MDAFLFQSLRRFQGRPYQMPDGDNRQVAPLLQHIAFADFKRTVCRREIGHGRTSAAQIHRPGVFCHRHGSLHRLVVVARVNHRHARHHAHHAHVFQGLVRGAVLAHAQPRMRRVNLYIGLGISHRLTDLVIHTPGGKFGESARKGNLAGHRQSGGDAYHVGFGDPHLKETFGISLGKSVHLYRTGQVGRQRHHLRQLLRGQHQPRAESGTCIFFFGVGIFIHGL